MTTIDTSFIDELIDDYNILTTEMITVNPGATSNITVHLMKLLILACASCYEKEFEKAYEIYAKAKSDRYGDSPHTFDNHKSDSYAYHRFKIWRMDSIDSNAMHHGVKSFLEPLKFFGKKFHESIEREVLGDDIRYREADAFHEIFIMRNLLAHNAHIKIRDGIIRDKTFNEIADKHKDALEFLKYLISKFS